MSRKITFRPKAELDLSDIDAYISRESPERAYAFVTRIRERCESLAQFAEQGTVRDDLGPGLRMLGLERRVTIAFRILPDRVQVVRIFYGGRYGERLLQREFRRGSVGATGDPDVESVSAAACSV